MLDLTRQLADLGAHLDATHPTPDGAAVVREAERRGLHSDGEVDRPLEEFVPLRRLEPLPTGRPRRRWVVAAAAAVAVLVLIGGVGLLARTLRTDTDVTEPTTTTTAPTTFVGSADWQRITGTAGGFAGTDWLHGAVATGSGFLAWGVDGDAGTVWYSGDGASWSEVHREPGAWFGGVVTVPQGLLAVGFSPCMEQQCELAPTIWTSPDGTAWETGNRFEEPNTGRACCGFSAIEAVGSRLVALAGDVTYSSSGGIAAGCGPTPCSTWSWTSDDAGATWSRHALLIEDRSQIFDLVAAGPGLVAVGATWADDEEGTPAVWHSADGDVWATIALPGGGSEMRGHVAAVAATSSGFVAVGQSNGSPAVWASDDGLDWTAISPVESVTGRLQDVAGLPSGSLVAVGENCDPAEVRTLCAAGVWNSPDGVSWVQAPHEESVFLGGGNGGAGMVEVAAGPLGVIAVGFSDMEDTATSWYSTPSPISTATAPTSTTTPAPSAPTGDAVSAEEVGEVIPVAGTPTAIAYGEGSLWVSNRKGDAGVVSRLDSTGNETATIEMGAVPRPDSIAAGDGAVWVGIEFLAEAGRIDPVANSFSGKWVEVGWPATVAVGLGHAWVLGQSLDDAATAVVSQLDAATGHVVAEIPVAPGGFSLGITAGGAAVWAGVDSGEPILYKIDHTSGEVVATLEIFPAYPMVDYDGGDTYMAYHGNALWVTGVHMVEEGGLLLRIDPTAAEIVESIRLDMRPTSMAVGAGRIWVLGWVGEGEKQVHVIDASTNAVTGGPIVFEHLPSDIAVGGGALWISHADSGFVTRIDVADIP